MPKIIMDCWVPISISEDTYYVKRKLPNLDKLIVKIT